MSPKEIAFAIDCFRRGEKIPHIAWELNHQRNLLAQRVSRQTGGPAVYDSITVSNLIEILEENGIIAKNEVEDIEKRMKNPRYDVASNFRVMVLKRDKNRCQVRRVNHAGQVEADHIVPVKEGGKSTLENGITLCHHCHAKKTHPGRRTEGWYAKYLDAVERVTRKG